jgi:hypothetical protein
LLHVVFSKFFWILEFKIKVDKNMNPIDFQGHRVKFLGKGIRHALHCPCYCINIQHTKSHESNFKWFYKVSLDIILTGHL